MEGILYPLGTQTYTFRSCRTMQPPVAYQATLVVAAVAVGCNSKLLRIRSSHCSPNFRSRRECRHAAQVHQRQRRAGRPEGRAGEDDQRDGRCHLQ